MWTVALEVAVFVVSSLIALNFFRNRALWDSVIPLGSRFLRVGCTMVAIGAAFDVLDNFGSYDPWLFPGADAARLVAEEVIGNILGNALVLMGIVLLVKEFTDTSVRMAAQQAEIVKRERQLREAQEVGGIGFFEYDIAADKLTWSDHVYGIMGYRLGEITPTRDRIFTMMHAEDADAFKAAVARTSPQQPDFSITSRIRTKSGSWKIVHTYGHCEYDSAGRGTRRYGTLQDITEIAQSRELAEARLRALKRAQAVGKVGTFEFDCRTGVHLSAYPDFPDLGFAANDPEKPATLFDLVHPEDSDGLQRAIQSGTPEHPRYEIEYRVRDKAGAWRTLQSSGEFEFDAHGAPLRRFGVNKDITEIVAARALAERSLAELRRAQEIGKVGQFEYDYRLDKLTWSDAGIRFLGYQPGEFQPTLPLLKDLMDPEQHANFESAIRRATPAHPSYESEFRIRHRTGKWLTFHVFGQCEFDAGGNLLRRFGINQDVTEIVAARQLAEERLDALNRAQSVGKVGTWEVDLDARVIQYSDYHREMMRYPSVTERFRDLEHLHDLYIADFADPKDRKIRGELFWQRMREVKPESPIEEYEYEAAMRTADGQRIHQLQRVQIVRDREGHIRRFLGTSVDITQMVAARQLADARLDALNRAQVVGKVGTFEVDLDARTIELSEQYQRMMEYEAPVYRFEDLDEMYRVYAREFADSDVGALRVATLRDAIANLKPETPLEVLESEAEIINAKGRRLHLLQRLQIIRDSDGRVKRLLGTSVDITARKRVELERLETERQFRLILDKSVQGIVIGTLERGMYANQAARSMLGWGDAPAVPNLDTLLNSLRTEEGWDGRAALNRLLSGENDSLRQNAVYRSEPELNLALTCSRVEWAGEPACHVTFLDVTKEVQAQAERARIEAQLRQSQKLETLGTLSGGIAHDFNNILTPILGFTELALDEVDGQSDLNDYLNQVRQASERGAQLVRQILSFSRHSESVKAPLVLGAIVGEVLKLARATLPASITIAREFKTEHDTVLADATQIHQVVMNLITNAKHAMKDRESGVLRVEIERTMLEPSVLHLGDSTDPEPWIRLSVGDNGCGMSPEVRERIFEPFFTTKDRGEGTGLGLSVVHGIVAGHGGTIVAYSELGVGTTFHVYLPVSAGAEVQTREVVPESALRGAERILVLDDETPVTALLQAGLSRLGYSVTAVNRPEEALALVRSDPHGHDALVTDQDMPGMSGLTLAREVRKAGSRLPILMITGFSERQVSVTLRELGVAAVLSKPLGVRSLAQALRGVLDGTSMEPRA